MTTKLRRFAQWAALLVGLLALGHVVSRAVPRANQLRFAVPRGYELRRIELSVHDAHEQVLRTVVLYPAQKSAKNLDYILSVAPGAYRLDVEYEYRLADYHDKNQGGGWTRVGLQHQIRLEGEDHRIPPPDDEAK